MKRFTICTILLVVTAIPGLGQAQWSVGPHIAISVPTAEFANVSDVGGGFGVKVVRQFSSVNGFALRGDFAFLSHGREFQTVNTFSGTFVAEVRQQSFRLNLGPQFTFGTDNLKFYVGARTGFYVFRTSINVSTGVGFITADDQADAAVGWNAGGGIQYDIGLGPLLDVAVEYQTIYNITTEFEIQDNQGQTVSETRDITANEFTVKLGVTFFLGK